jgi:hypothetical protein
MKNPMKIPFDFSNNDFIGLMNYRLACVLDDQEGIVLADGKEYMVTRWGNFENAQYNESWPKAETEHFRLTSELIKAQLSKHKREKNATSDKG